MYLDGYVYPNTNYGYEVIQRVPNVDAVSACRVPLDGRVRLRLGEPWQRSYSGRDASRV